MHYALAPALVQDLTDVVGDPALGVIVTLRGCLVRGTGERELSCRSSKRRAKIPLALGYSFYCAVGNGVRGVKKRLIWSGSVFACSARKSDGNTIAILVGLG